MTPATPSPFLEHGLVQHAANAGAEKGLEAIRARVAKCLPASDLLDGDAAGGELGHGVVARDEDVAEVFSDCGGAGGSAWERHCGT